jgi:hypothetical protein
VHVDNFMRDHPSPRRGSQRYAHFLAKQTFPGVRFVFRQSTTPKTEKSKTVFGTYRRQRRPHLYRLLCSFFKHYLQCNPLFFCRIHAHMHMIIHSLVYTVLNKVDARRKKTSPV